MLLWLLLVLVLPLGLFIDVFKVVPSRELTESPFGVFAPGKSLSDVFLHKEKLEVAQAVLALCVRVLNIH